jgi:hypothetical protein
MPIDFPTSPTLNQTYTFGGRTWSWNGFAWDNITTTFGPQGVQGTQGLQGIQGTQGLVGIQGTQGTQGIQGEQGLQGTQGLTGTQGNTGLQGTTGSGAQGTTGTQGLTGTQGAIGDDGFIAQTSAPVNTSLLWLDTDEPADTTILAINAQTGTAYTLGSGDFGNLVTLSNTSAITVTIPPSVFTTGQIINLQQINTGQVTFAQGAGVTITSTGATSTAPKLRTQYSGCTVICVGADSFTVVGDLS